MKKVQKKLKSWLTTVNYGGILKVDNCQQEDRYG